MSTLRASAWAPRLVASTTVLTVAIVVFAGCWGLEAAPSKTTAGARSGSLAVATKYYEDKLTKCGDSYITNWTFSDGSGSRLVELKGVRYNISPIPITQADRLNGLDDAFESWIQPTAARRTTSPRDDWEPWRDEKSVFHFRFLKVKGNWNVTPVLTGGGFLELTGYLAKYPCNELPGNPARLAREEAERRLAAEARQVGAVSFTCGPVRNFSGYGTQSISVTDASVTGIDGLPDTSVAFIDAQYLSKFNKDNLDGPGIWLSGKRPYNRLGEWGFRFRGPSAEANRDACYDGIAASYERWRARFPTLAKLPPLASLAVADASLALADAPGGAEFQAKCAACHGANGGGQTPVGTMLKVRDLRSQEVQQQSDTDLTKILADGKGKMPAYGSKLSATDISAIVTWIRKIGSR
jgi:cytochrome c6